MLNFFKKTVNLDFYCSEDNNNLVDSLRPQLSSKLLPNWYKNLNHSYQTQNKFGLVFKSSTVRHCYGIKKTLTNGFVIPLWSDFIIKIYPDKNYTFQFSDGKSTASVHDKPQYEGLLDDSLLLKVNTPWACKSNVSKDFYMTQPIYHTGYYTDYMVLPGFLNFFYNSTLNIFLVFKVKPEPYQVLIPVGTPLAHVITEDNAILKAKTEVVSFAKFDALRSPNRISFEKSFNKYIKFRNKLNGD